MLKGQLENQCMDSGNVGCVQVVRIKLKHRFCLFVCLFFLALILLLACKTGADSELGQLDLTKVRVSVGADGCEREGR